MDWLKIGSALFMAAMLVMMFPRMRDAMKNSRKGSNNEWMGFVMIIAVVGFFVFLLTKLV